MEIDEVNLEIRSSIFAELMVWLKSHIKEILTLNGFLKADLLSDKNEEQEGVKKITVIYHVIDYNNYCQYINKYATNMRNDSIQRFAGQLTVSGRLLQIEETYQN